MSRITVDVPLRWSDIDAYSHVNNAELLRILEEARIQAFWVSDDPQRASTAILEATPGAGTATLIARLEIEYLAPIAYQRQPLRVQMWLSHLGGASLEMCYEVYDHSDSELSEGPLPRVSRPATETQNRRRGSPKSGAPGKQV